MRKGRELRVHPPLAGPDDGKVRLFSEIEGIEKEHMFCLFSEHVQSGLSRYYSAHPEEWASLWEAVQRGEES